MKKYFFSWVILFLSIHQIIAQNNWFQVNNNIGNFQFEVPQEPAFHQEDSTMMYVTSALDTTIIMQVHYADQHQDDIDAANEIKNISQEAFYDNFAKLLLIDNKGATLESLDDVVLSNGLKGKEIGIRYSILSEDNLVNDERAEDEIFPPTEQVRFMFIRVFWHNQKNYIFTIDCLHTSLPDLPTFKNNFFQSIFINL